MLRRGLLAAFAAIALAGFGAQAGAAGSEADALRQAGERGRLIYDYDGAAWVSTDALVGRFPDPAKAGLAGYVVEPGEGGRLRAVYYGMRDGAPKAVFIAEVKGRKVVSSHALKPDEDATLSPLALRLIAAREAAAKEAQAKRYAPCERAAFNSVALPPATPGGTVSVYLMTPQVRQNELPAGGHYRVDVDADGKVIASRGFTRSCLPMSTVSPGGAQTVGLMLNHLLDPTPTEIHVFLSLSAGMPVFVATSDGKTWKVEGAKIGELKR